MAQQKQSTSEQQMRSTRLSVDKIKMDTHEFQFRDASHDPNHVNELVNAIKRGDTLDPMIVWQSPNDGEYYVIAGHHRLIALRRVKKTARVRVRVFEGSLRNARLIAVQSNKKAVLTPSNAERQDSAWRLVCMWSEKAGYEYSVQETYKAAGIGRAQVSNMRKVRKTLTACEETLPNTWLAARLAVQTDSDEDMTEVDREELLNAQVAELDKKIGSVITEAGHKYPNALAKLLAQRLGPKGHAVASFCETVGSEYEEGEDEDPELADFPF